jgi:hypothetical protein
VNNSVAQTGTQTVARTARERIPRWKHASPCNSLNYSMYLFCCIDSSHLSLFLFVSWLPSWLVYRFTILPPTVYVCCKLHAYNYALNNITNSYHNPNTNRIHHTSTFYLSLPSPQIKKHNQAGYPTQQTRWHSFFYIPYPSFRYQIHRSSRSMLSGVPLSILVIPCNHSANSSGDQEGG